MLSDNPFIQALQNFVPNDLQLTSSSFYKHLFNLKYMRFDIRCESIETSVKGITVILYDASKTDMQFFTWTDLAKQIANAFPKPTFDLSQQTALFGDIEVQLKHSF